MKTITAAGIAGAGLVGTAGSAAAQSISLDVDNILSDNDLIGPTVTDVADLSVPRCPVTGMRTFRKMYNLFTSPPR